MDILNVKAYAVRRIRNGKIEYWHFFIDCWVSPEEFDLNCITSEFVATNFVKKGNGGEVVKLKINVKEAK